MSSVGLASGFGSGGQRLAISRAWAVYASAAVKVAYIFSTSGHTASYKLGKMILPQLEARNSEEEGDLGRRVAAPCGFECSAGEDHAGDE